MLMPRSLVKQRFLHPCILLLLISSLCAEQSSSFPVETLLLLQNRTVSLQGGTVTLGGAIRTEEDLPRYKRAAQALPTTEEGLSRLLSEGTEEDGLISRATSLSACLIKTNQGRRVAILNAFLELVAFTQFVNDGQAATLRTGVIDSSAISGEGIDSDNLTIVTLDDNYPFDSLKAQRNPEVQDRTGVRIIDESRTTDMAFAKDLRELCDQTNENEVEITAEGEDKTTITNVTFESDFLGRNNPFARLPNHADAVRVRYDTYELVLQAIAVALLLLDLFILDDFQRRKIKFYHWAGVTLLAVATVITVIMGYLQVLQVLKEDSVAWSSCGSHDIKGTELNSSVEGVQYEVLCEWVVIRAASTGLSYLVLLPSALGAALLLLAVGRFTVIKYRRHIAPPEELDEEEKLVREREREAGYQERSKSPLFKRILPHFAASKALVLVFSLLAMVGTVHAQQFPPSELKRNGPNLIGNNEILFLGGVATTSPFRCAWESRTGPTDDSTSEGTSLGGSADDCFVRWAPPTEDESTGLLFGQGKIVTARCNKGVRCPFTGNVCPSDFGNFECRTSFKDPGPINFLPEWEVKMVDRVCRFGSNTSVTLCRLRMIRWLAKKELHMLTSQIQTKLNDERVNIHRISEYVFPDCAAPPRNFSGFAFGKGTGEKHFSATGIDCRNSFVLTKVAKENVQKACNEDLDALNVCPQSQNKSRKRHSRRWRRSYRLRRWRRWGHSSDCRKHLEHLCTDALYTQLVIKSRNMRAMDDWLIARCHQSGNTMFGGFKGSWKTNDESIVGSGDLPKDKGGNPLIRPVRQGWKFKQFRFPRRR